MEGDGDETDVAAALLPLETDEEPLVSEVVETDDGSVEMRLGPDTADGGDEPGR